VEPEARPLPAKALSCIVGQWKALNAFCRDGAVPIDNTVSEREMKRVVLNRKHSLFVGNPRAGRTAAILASLTSICRRHGVDPQLYLTRLLVNLPALRTSELPQWLPDQWKRRQTPPAADSLPRSAGSSGCGLRSVHGRCSWTTLVRVEVSGRPSCGSGAGR